MTKTQMPGQTEKMCPPQCWIMYGMLMRPPIPSNYLPEQHRKYPKK